MALAAALIVANAAASAHDESKYPDWSGQWRRPQGVGIQWDPSKPLGPTQQAPLTPEYQKVFEASLADQAAGGQGDDPTYTCIPPGMPRAMTVVFPMEIVITPAGHLHPAGIRPHDPPHLHRRPRLPEGRRADLPGYSIGKWLDTDGDGKFDTLEIETRNIKGPRTYDASGIPLHDDNTRWSRSASTLDKENKDMLRYEITTIDNALTRPWTVMKTYRRDLAGKVVWFEYVCAEDNHHVVVGKENYFVSGDGYLMPTRKGPGAART